MIYVNVKESCPAIAVGMGIFGIIGIILGVVDWRLIAGNKEKA